MPPSLPKLSHAIQVHGDNGKETKEILKRNKGLVNGVHSKSSCRYVDPHSVVHYLILVIAVAVKIAVTIVVETFSQVAFSFPEEESQFFVNFSGRKCSGFNGRAGLSIVCRRDGGVELRR